MNYSRSNLEANAIIGLVKLTRLNTRNMLYRRKCFYRSQFYSNVLFRTYQISNYPSLNARKDLSILLDMSARSIQIWFENVREDYVPSINLVFRNITSAEILHIYTQERYKFYKSLEERKRNYL